MKKLFALCAGAIELLSLAYASGSVQWDGSYKRFSGEYLIYSGGLGEQQPPTQRERNAAFMIQGQLAREMFESIGPDLKDACGAAVGMRARQKGDVDCSYDKTRASSAYICYFGIDLKTGKSMSGSIC